MDRIDELKDELNALKRDLYGDSENEEGIAGKVAELEMRLARIEKCLESIHDLIQF